VDPASQQGLEDNLAELLEQDVIEGPWQEEESGTWISNLVITTKAWDKEKDKRPGKRVQIRANLNCCLLKEVVYQTHKPITTVAELQHTMKGSTRFPKLDMAHCFHKFEIEELARKLFTFQTPKGLYQYKRLVMGNNPASLECHKWVMEVGRLQKVLHKLQEGGFTLRRGMAKVVVQALILRRRDEGAS
jgi:hypothetical protein